MTVKELKGALENAPDNAEVYFDDGYSINALPTDNAEYDEYSNILIIA